MLRLRQVVAGGVAVFAIAAGTAVFAPLPAYAANGWRAEATGSGRTQAQSIPEPAAPTALVSGRQVTVSWSATTMSGGTPVPQYVVRRFDQNNVAKTIGAACAGRLTATSCVESNVPTGQWRYTVQGVAGSFWAGPQSALSATVTVAAATLVFTSSTTITSLPATLNGTISNFALLEPITFRLDSATGPVLSGTPANASLLGTAGVTVTIPAGTSDAPHSVFVVGGGLLSTNVAAAAINIVIPPKLLSLSMRDDDANGKIERVLATFDDTLAPYSAGVASWTLANVPSGGTLQSVSVSGAVATLALAEGPGAASTAAGSFTIALAANSAGIRDVYEHPTSFAATAVSDGAAPAAFSLVMQDSTANGKVDRVVATFSEPLASYTAGNTPWTLANVPSAGSLASSGVAVSGTTATLTITEGTGAVATGVGGFTVALGSSATGIRDAAGNRSAFTARAPSDGVVPIRTALEMFDVNKNGKVDRVVATFSEALAASSATTPWTLTNVPSGGALNAVSVTGTAATLNLIEGPNAANSAVGTFRVALAANAAGVRDAAGNQALFAAVAPTDKAAPAFVLSLQDSNNNGRVDRLRGTLSETPASYDAGNTPWTLSNVPSGGTLSGAVVSGTTLTVTITEGAGAVDTAVGSMTYSLAASATGIRDTAGNLTTYSSVAPVDAARPFVATIADSNGATDGLIQPGDTLSITFSEALNPATIPALTTVTLTDPNTTGSDTLTIAGITSGARSTGNNGYVLTNNTSAIFANSPVVLSNGNRTVTITVGPACSGTGCASLAAPSGTPTFSYLGATTLADPAANVATTTAKTQAIKLF